MNCEKTKSINFWGSLIISSVLYLLLICAVIEELIGKNFKGGALLVVAAFTFMLTTSALLYTRVQAWPPGRMRRRFLYAAEYCFGGAALFGLLILVAGIVFSVYSAVRPLASGDFGYLDIALLFGVFFCYGFFASYDFIYGIRIAIHRKPWSMSLKAFLRSQKRSI